MHQVQAYQPSLVVRSWSDWDTQYVAASEPDRPCAYLVGSGFDDLDTYTSQLTRRLLKSADAPVLVDGGALNILSAKKIRDLTAQRYRRGQTTIVTPHMGEAARLAKIFNLKTTEPDEMALQLAQAYGVICVLKSHDTFISDGQEILAMREGTAALAKAGTGDVLAGIIGGSFGAGHGRGRCLRARHDAPCACRRFRVGRPDGNLRVRRRHHPLSAPCHQKPDQRKAGRASGGDHRKLRPGCDGDVEPVSGDRGFFHRRKSGCARWENAPGLLSARCAGSKADAVTERPPFVCMPNCNDTAPDLRRRHSCRRRATWPAYDGVKEAKHASREKGAVMATYKKKWDWTLIVIGVLLIICGIVAATYPGLTLVIITTMVGIGYLLSGVGDVAAYFKLRKRMDVSGWALAYAVLDIVLGALLLLYRLRSWRSYHGSFAFGFLLFGIVEIWISVKAKQAGRSQLGTRYGLGRCEHPVRTRPVLCSGKLCAVHCLDGGMARYQAHRRWHHRRQGRAHALAGA